MALGLSGCLRVDATLVLHGDATVSGSYTYALTDADVEGLGMSSSSIAAQLGPDELAATLAHPTTTPVDEGDYHGVRVDFTDEPISTFDGTTLSDGITIVRDGDEYVVTGPDLTTLAPEDAALLADAHLTFSVTFAGAVSDHNGTLNGKTVTWDVTTSDPVPYARGLAAGPGFPWIVAGAGAVFVASLGGLWWLRRRNARATSTT